MKTIPIFIITFNRLDVLKKSIDSFYKCISDPFEIIIHDNGTTFPDTLKYIEYLELNGIKVYRNNKITWPGELENIRNSVQDYLSKNPSDYYIITDCDIALNSNTDILEFYSYIHEKEKINVVGPSLDLNDLPDHYPKKSAVLSWEEKFWQTKMKEIEFKGNKYKLQWSPIDTTFGMYKSDFIYTRQSISLESIRVHPPYSAKHLDWYLDPNNLSEDQKFYNKESSINVTNWSKLPK